MKLHEISQFEHDVMHKTMTALYDLNNKLVDHCKISNYKINADGSLDVKTDISFYGAQLDKLPFKFNRVRAFDVRHNDLTSFENFPTICQGRLAFSGNKIKSLVGINDHIKEAGFISSLYNSIIEGGLGLLLIDKLTGINFELRDERAEQAFQIIKNYIGKPNDIFECQNELIEAGLDEFAQI